MRSLSLILMVLGSWLLSAAWADQNDPELDALFSQLRNGVEDIVSVQGEIESRWITAPEASTQILVSRTIEAIELGEMAVADILADHITGIAPHFAEGWVLRGYVSSLKDDLVSAELSYSRALALEPRHYNALEALGDLAHEADRDDDAFSYYRQALEHHPNLPGVREKVDQLRFEMGSQEI